MAEPFLDMLGDDGVFNSELGEKFIVFVHGKVHWEYSVLITVPNPELHVLTDISSGSSGIFVGHVEHVSEWFDWIAGKEDYSCESIVDLHELDVKTNERTLALSTKIDLVTATTI